jgi:hypothetical protein
MQRVVILNGPVAQPGRVPDFYHRKEIRLSRVRIPTGPLSFSFESARFIADNGSTKKTIMTEKTVDRSILEGESIELFRAAIKSAATRDPMKDA